jgi:hypothetical protein
MIPTSTQTSRRALVVVAAALIVAAAVALRVAVTLAGADYDDALITFRYADRIASGLGFTYNDGERVLGTTTPLWTLLLSGASRLGLAIPGSADVFNNLFDALSLLLVIWIGARAGGHRTAIFTGILYGISPLLVRSTSYGMEAPLFNILSVGAMVLFIRGRAGWTGVLLGLAAWTRLEGILLAGCVVLLSVRRPRDLAWTVGMFGLVIAPWILFATSYFGSPLPHSLQAKLVHTYRPDHLDTLHFLFAEGPIRTVLGTLGVAGAVLAVRARNSALLLPVLFAGAYATFYVIGHPNPYEWYLPPLYLPMSLFGGYALAQAMGVLKGPRLWIAVALTFALGGGTLLGTYMLRQAREWRAMVEGSYVPLADWISSQTSEDDRVFCGDIGYIGYRTGRWIVDASGLVSEEVLTARREGLSADDLISVIDPEILVVPLQPGVYPVAWPDSLTEARYEAVARFPDVRPIAPSPTEAEIIFRSRARWEPTYVLYRRRNVP